ncbi:MAG TPA: hypothetical protein VLA78_12395 [Paracoccaceae bacterium]|nr:hypothetical protein [Paracoccaceae bacterium]
MEANDPMKMIGDLHVLAEETGALAERMAEGQQAAAEVGLRVLLAEMQALAAVLPAAHPPRSDAEIEADFDNMPV